MRNLPTAERVEKFENVESQDRKVCESEFLKFLRATDLMFECGLTVL